MSIMHFLLRRESFFVNRNLSVRNVLSFVWSIHTIIQKDCIEAPETLAAENGLILRNYLTQVFISKVFQSCLQKMHKEKQDMYRNNSRDLPKLTNFLLRREMDVRRKRRRGGEDEK